MATTAPRNNDSIGKNTKNKTTIMMMEQSQHYSSSLSLTKKPTKSTSKSESTLVSAPPSPIASGAPRQRFSKFLSSRRPSRKNNTNNHSNGTPPLNNTTTTKYNNNNITRPKKNTIPPKMTSTTTSPAAATTAAKAASPRDVISMPAVTMMPSPGASSSQQYRKHPLSPVESPQSSRPSSTQTPSQSSPGPFQYIHASSCISLSNISQVTLPTIGSTNKNTNKDNATTTNAGMKKKKKQEWWCGETKLDLDGNLIHTLTTTSNDKGEIDDTSILFSAIQFNTTSFLLLQRATLSIDDYDDHGHDANDKDTVFTCASLSTSRTITTKKKKDKQHFNNSDGKEENDTNVKGDSCVPQQQQKYCWKDDGNEKSNKQHQQRLHRLRRNKNHSTAGYGGCSGSTSSQRSFHSNSQRSLNSKSSLSSIQSSQQHFLVTMNSSSFGGSSSKMSNNNVTITSTDFDQLLRAMKVAKYNESHKNLNNTTSYSGISSRQDDIDSANPFVEVVQLDKCPPPPPRTSNNLDQDGAEVAVPEASWWSFFNFENNNTNDNNNERDHEFLQNEGTIIDHNSHHDVRIVSYEIQQETALSPPPLQDDLDEVKCNMEEQQIFEVVLVPKDEADNNISSQPSTTFEQHANKRNSKGSTPFCGLQCDNKENENKKRSTLITMLESVQKQEEKLGSDHSDVAVSYERLGDYYYKRLQYDSCLKCYFETLRIRQLLSNSSSGTGEIEEIVKTLNTIGKVYYKIGNGTLAMDRHREAYDLLCKMASPSPTTSKKERDDLYFQTLICIGRAYYRVRNSLCSVRQSYSNRNNSEPIQLLPYNDFYKTGMLDKISEAHANCGSYGMAISFLEEKLQLLKTAGPSSSSSSAASATSGSLNSSKPSRHHHKEAAATLRNLGFLCCKTGCYLEALEYHDLAYDIEQKIVMSALHIASARILKGSATYLMGDYSISKMMFKEAIQMFVRSSLSSSNSSGGGHGKDNALYPLALRGLGAVQRELYEFVSADKSFDQALRIERRLLGVNHPETLLTRLEIAKLWVCEFHLDKAMKELTFILEAQIRIHGKKHPNVADTLETVGNVHALKGELSLALDKFEQCFFMREFFLGIGHPQVATVLHNIANIHARDAKHEKALRILTNVLLIRKETFSEDHIDIARSLTSKGHSLVALGQMKEALKCFSDGHRIARSVVGGSHPVLANIHANMGRLHLHKCEYDTAQRYLREALETYEAFELNDSHPDVVQAKDTLGRLANQELLCV